MQILRTLVVSGAILWAARLRTILSAAAFSIGVIAVVLMFGIGEAAQREVRAAIAVAGERLVVIQPGTFDTIAGATVKRSASRTMTLADVKLLRAELGPSVAVSGRTADALDVRRPGNGFITSVEGVEPSFFAMTNTAIAAGRALDGNDVRTKARVCVLGPSAARKLSGGEALLGTTVRIRRQPFRVVGIAAPKSRGAVESEDDLRVLIPLTTALDRVLRTQSLAAILVQAPDSSAIDAVTISAAAALRKAHRLRPGAEDDFVIQDQTRLIEAEHATGGSIRTMLGAIAAASLLAGSVALAVVMSLAVRERRWEIGLRRALGAPKGAILFQFLIEAAFLAGMGAAMGAILGVIGTLIACRSIGWPMVYPWASAAGAFVTATLVGVGAGVIPGSRAAALDPAAVLQAR